MFAKTSGEIIGVFAQTTASFFAKIDHSIVFLEKRQF
jgi:hypothetical protein